MAITQGYTCAYVLGENGNKEEAFKISSIYHFGNRFQGESAYDQTDVLYGRVKSLIDEYTKYGIIVSHDGKTIGYNDLWCFLKNNKIGSKYHYTIGEPEM